MLEHPPQNESDFVDILSSSSYLNKRVPYTGYIDSSINMSPNTANQKILMFQSKIKAQAKEIDRLKHETERQRSRIKSLEEALLQANSIKPTKRSRISR